MPDPQPERTTTPTISVVVLSRDEPELANSLDALAPQCRELGAECIVVDSSQGRLDAIRQAHPWVTWIDFTPPPRLPSSIPHARNCGVRASNGTVVAFCDSGGLPDPGWLEALSTPIIQGSTELTCGPIYSTRPSVYQTMNDVSNGAIVEAPPTANVAFSRVAFDDVAGFDERYAYGSDIDFAWRQADAGHNVICMRAAVMRMDWGPPALQWRRAWRYGRARARMLYFHPSRRLAVVRSNPETAFYPAWWATLPLAALIARKRGLRVLLPWVLAPLALVVKNRKHPKPVAVVLDHLVYGAAMDAELASQLTSKPRQLIRRRRPR